LDDPIQRGLFGTLVAALTGALWYVRRHIARVDNLDARVNLIERQNITREELSGKLDRHKKELRQELDQQRDDIKYIRKRIDQLIDRP